VLAGLPVPCPSDAGWFADIECPSDFARPSFAGRAGGRYVPSWDRQRGSGRVALARLNAGHLPPPRTSDPLDLLNLNPKSQHLTLTLTLITYPPTFSLGWHGGVTVGRRTLRYREVAGSISGPCATGQVSSHPCALTPTVLVILWSRRSPSTCTFNSGPTLDS